MASFGLNSLFSAYMASSGLNGTVLSWPSRPCLASTALISAFTTMFSLNGLFPASMASSGLVWPRSASTALSRPPWPRPALFDLYSLVSAFMALSMASNGLVWPQRSYPGIHGLVRPHLASTASIGLQWPRSASMALSRPPWLRPALTASFDLYSVVSASTALSMASNGLVRP